MVPNGIILDTEKEVKRLCNVLNRTEMMFSDDYFFSHNLRSHLIDKMKNVKTAKHELTSLVNQLRSIEHDPRDISQQSCHDFIESVEVLGNSILEQLLQYKAYKLDGVLDYTYYPVEDERFHDTLLVRTYAFPRISDQTKKSTPS